MTRPVRLREDGPAVVAIGGGHGLAASLRAVRRYAGEITAVVSVADDGGSSGRLRAAAPVPPPGDLRKCLVALAAERTPLVAALEHRFVAGDVAGHAVGNLLLAALDVVLDDPVAALDEMGRLVDAVGRVLPAAVEPVTLVGTRADRSQVRGQVAVMAAEEIVAVRLDPGSPAVSPEVDKAILAADQVILGPGSLYTSVLAAATVPEVRRALRDTAAPRIYVANLHPQEPETAGYDVADHVAALHRHGVRLDVVLYDPATLPLGSLDTSESGIEVVEAQLANHTGLAHDDDRLGAALAGLVRAPRGADTRRERHQR